MSKIAIPLPFPKAIQINSVKKKTWNCLAVPFSFCTFAAGFPVPPGEAARYKGLPTFKDERLARICPNLKRGKFQATDGMQ